MSKKREKWIRIRKWPHDEGWWYVGLWNSYAGRYVTEYPHLRYDPDKKETK
jgi:hypothetical protein